VVQRSDQSRVILITYGDARHVEGNQFGMLAGAGVVRWGLVQVMNNATIYVYTQCVYVCARYSSL
jgi:hypothetical protein